MRIAAIGLLALCILGAYQKPKKPPEVVILDTKAHRVEGKILVDCHVRANAEKPLHGLVVVFDLLSPENGVMASERAVLDEDSLESGDERSCHSETSDNARAVKYKIRAFDIGEKELRVENDGPFQID